MIKINQNKQSTIPKKLLIKSTTISLLLLIVCAYVYFQMYEYKKINHEILSPSC